MRIVALEAIADGGIVDTSLDFIGILVAMALDAELDRSYGLEIDAGHIRGRPDFVAGQAARCDCRMDGLPLQFILMTLQTFFPIDVLPQVNRMLPCYCEGKNG